MSKSLINAYLYDFYGMSKHQTGTQYNPSCWQYYDGIMYFQRISAFFNEASQSPMSILRYRYVFF